MRQLFAYSVLLTLSDGRALGYLVQALNSDIAISKCVLACLKEDDSRTFREKFVYRVTLDEPLCYIDTAND